MNALAKSSETLSRRPQLYAVKDSGRRRSSNRSLITPAAAYEFNTGNIPDLRMTCLELFRTFDAPGAPQSALHAIPVLQDVNRIGQNMLQKVWDNPKTSHVLVHNEILKIVLIHWPTGKISSIHGHPKGGCMFKVLHGSVEELRYSTKSENQLLSTSTYHAGGMAYIDDTIAYHAVGNPFNEPALSLHVYTYADSYGRIGNV